MTSSTETHETQSPVPSAVRAILDLFSGHLAQLHFPDVDAASLSAGVGRVEAGQAALQTALEAVQLAREVLEREQVELGEQALKAHAYASVFASDQPELSAMLADIDLDGRAKRRARKLRPPKSKSKSQARSRAKSQAKSQASLAVAEPGEPESPNSESPNSESPNSAGPKPGRAAALTG